MPEMVPCRGGVLQSLKRRACILKLDTYVLYLAVRDPRTPWYAKALAGAVVAYALSPIDLIPDFIPVIGYLDDLILVPLGIALALKLIPETVMSECRQRARAGDRPPLSRVGAAFMIAVWLAAAVWFFFFVRGLFS
jgi:uncharacterized membrane protein YkvA (DUF1232 family)